MSENFFRALRQTQAPFPSAEERLFDDEGMLHHGPVLDEPTTRILVVGANHLAQSALMGTLKGLGPLAETVFSSSLLSAREVFLRSPYPYWVIAIMRPDDDAYLRDVIDLEESTRLRMGARWIGYWPTKLPQEVDLPKWQAHIVAPLPLGILKRILQTAA